MMGLLEVGPRADDGFLELVMPARLDAASMTALLDGMLEVEAEDPDARLCVLVDIRGLEAMDAAARSVVYRRSPESRLREFAILGRSLFHAVLFRFVTFATRQPNSRYFTDADAARGWLRTFGHTASTQSRGGFGS
ncbi:MAG: hypothetical protein HYT80_02225 [Euryarchaeota archaeon]|nr:hypothetical protein [Euryarchaeota archaeon]